MKEISAAKGASDDGVDLAAGARNSELGAATNMREDIALAELDQGQFGIVGVSRIVFKTVATSSEKTKGFVKIFLVSIATKLTAQFNRLAEELPDQSSGGIDVKVFACDVVLQAC